MTEENFSILEQIISNQKAEEVENLDAVEIINNLFTELSERERDVLIRRYGLHSTKKETLENIGKAHSLTRERIRQIESSSVKKLQELKNLRDYLSNLRHVIYQLLEEHGGIMERNYLLDLLVGFSVNNLRAQETELMIHKNYLNFMITKLLNNEFEELSGHRHFLDSYKMKFKNISHLEELVAEFHRVLQEKKRVFLTHELINLAKELNTYQKHQDKIKINFVLDIAPLLKNDLFEEPADSVNNNKVLYSILRASKKIQQNKFGHWGLANWREISPKTINDKIYLVLKNHGKPLHFSEIADRINKVSFDNKKANAATVHNELILDKKYVLVGRGLYALKEWGYRRGAVADVIELILNENDGPLNRDEIIDRVLEKRLVKKATIILALMNKEKFKRVDGKYMLNKEE